jgi:hypothetical protein
MAVIRPSEKDRGSKHPKTPYLGSWDSYWWEGLLSSAIVTLTPPFGGQFGICPWVTGPYPKSKSSLICV